MPVRRCTAISAGECAKLYRLAIKEGSRSESPELRQHQNNHRLVVLENLSVPDSRP